MFKHPNHLVIPSERSDEESALPNIPCHPERSEGPMHLPV